MKIYKKLFFTTLILICSIFIFKNVEATTISVSPANPKKGESVTITVSVPNVNTVDLTATVSGAGTSGTIRLVDGSMTGEAKTFSKSITVTPTTAGTISIFIASSSNAVLDGQYVNVSASKNVTVTEPVVNPPIDNGNNNNNNNNNNNTNVKDTNNYLKSLQVNAEGLSPRFVKTTQNYAITIAENVNELKITATPESNKSKVYISGNTDLKDGNNTITITVVAENGAKRYYKITATKVADPAKSNAFLSNLVVQGIDLDPVFQKETLEYNIGKISKDIEKFNILAFPEDENAKIEIIGNDELKPNKNQVIIRVTAPDGTTVKEYILNYEKEEIALVEDSDPLNSIDENKSDNIVQKAWKVIKANALILTMFIFILVEFAQIVYLYLNLNKKPKLLAESKIKRNKISNENKIENKDENLIIEGLKENPKVELKRRSANRNAQKEEK